MTLPPSTSITNLRAARNRRYYEKHRKRGADNPKPFIGVDGEGGGTDDIGRQNFLLLRAGEMELFNSNHPLSTRECLDFLLSTPKDAILCGYYFTYDATQILRDLPPERIANLFESKARIPGISPYTFWEDYAIEFRPRQYFRVGRLNRKTLKVKPGTSRTVNEVGGFFQKSFVEAIKDWKVGDKATVDMIASLKDQRETFTTLTQVERDYCAAECRYLADMMTKLRDMCAAAGIEPRAWRGAGWLAARLHELHGTQKQSERKRSKALEIQAIRSYYGGRFEVTTIGKIEGPVYEYDINSAYPAAMLALPCPVHTRWKVLQSGQDARGEGRLYASRVRFSHDLHSGRSQLCSLPVRRKGRLFWPAQGEGWYWSNEIDAAIRAGTEITEWKGGYYAEKRCDCPSHEWVRELFVLRKSLGKSEAGYPIKLGINGLYGKYAQRLGAAPWRDYIAAGIITATVRAKLIDAYRQAPEAIIYLATDALFSRRILQVDLGEGLGQWEAKTRDNGLFIVQPGIYWTPGSDDLPKTRGIPRSRVIEAKGEFEAAWSDWIVRQLAAGDPPKVTVPVKTFIGHRQALAWGRPEQAGSWITLGNGGRNISFAWKEKRDAARWGITGVDGLAVKTCPREGGADYVSEPYDPAQLTELAAELLLEEGADDFRPWGNSGE